MSNFEKCSDALFFKSPRVDDLRLGDMVQSVATKDVSAGSCVLLGYPDDEGIRVNFGRGGSREAPDNVRKCLYKMAPTKKDFPELTDLGNYTNELDLVGKQSQLISLLSHYYKNKNKVISIGGGHDYAYPDVAAFLNQKHKKKPLVINIDAHLDVRKNVNGPNSGTPFYQLLEKHSSQFDLVQIGIQPQSNSLAHFEYCKLKKVKVIEWSKSAKNLRKVFQQLSRVRRPAFLSVDIDGFSAAYAPGCSAPSPIGLSGDEFLLELPQLVQQLDIMGLGIYEVSPQFDLDQRTSRLAALIIHTYLQHV